MKVKAILFAALVMILSMSAGVSAQTLSTDIVFLKVGYIPAYVIDYKMDGVKDVSQQGLALQGEYNLNFSNFWIGFGLEWERFTTKDFPSAAGTEEKITSQFLVPMVSFKFAAFGGLYVGAGLSGKYLLSATKLEDTPDYSIEYKKEFDLWGNIMVGYFLPIAEAVFLDFEARFGYNFTKKQYKETEKEWKTSSVVSPSAPAEMNSQYDITFFVGIGYRTFGSDY